VSKEIARQYYRKTEWYEQVEEAKRKAKDQGTEDWKMLCHGSPPKLDKELKVAISQMYKAATNEVVGKEFFDTPSLAQVVKGIER
jgi:phosphoribosylaminoimidazole-succinocarboxamide synthase